MAEQDRENFFQSLTDVLDEAESVATEQQRELTGLHLEDAVSALQQVISLVPDTFEKFSGALSRLEKYIFRSLLRCCR